MIPVCPICTTEGIPHCIAVITAVVPRPPWAVGSIIPAAPPIPAAPGAPRPLPGAPRPGGPLPLPFMAVLMAHTKELRLPRKPETLRWGQTCRKLPRVHWHSVTKAEPVAEAPVTGSIRAWISCLYLTTQLRRYADIARVSAISGVSRRGMCENKDSMGRLRTHLVTLSCMSTVSDAVQSVLRFELPVRGQKGPRCRAAT
jgi:hypothetical protein